MAMTVISISGVEQNAKPAIIFDVNDEMNSLAPALSQVLQCGVTQPLIRAFLDMQSDPKIDTPAVIEAGLALYLSITRHKNAESALSRTLAAPANSETRKIRFHIKNGVVPEAHNIPWETLRDPARNVFFALDARVPFVRVIETSTDASRASRDLPGMHLKLLAVIAAKGTSGRAEWQALKRSLAHWPFPVTVKVFVYEDALLQEIANEPPNIAAEFVPGQSGELAAKIGEFKPHICHFFCHGHSDGGGYLEIANRATQHGGDPLSLRTGPLVGPLQSAWLVMLNACSGAKVDLESNSTSIASGLVHAGIPVVVGMREQVPVDVVAGFTQAFLTGTLRYLATTLSDGNAVSVDFCQALVDGRDAICASFGNDPVTMGKRTKEWTLPVMYVSSAGLLVTATRNVPVATSEEFTRLAAERATFKKFLRDMGDQLPPNAQAQIENKIAEIDALIGKATA